MSHSKNDSFGRKVFDELQLGTGFVSRQFSYHAGEVTEEHKDNKKLKSSPTTQLVSQIVISDGRTLSYEYDEEERITKVTDSIEGTTEYTYDALGQLLTETVNGSVVNTMTYDNYGNILTKNGVEYTYGDGVWKDLLTGYGDKTITYDAQGNPVNYLGHTLTWEKGRQLKSFDNVTYTYNANGIRTSKTVNGVKHTYTLDGTKILREVWGDNTLVPLYDNEKSVCGILYNDVPYYFLKNLQGDVIAITDKDGSTAAKYSYDAWGKCTVTQDSSGCSISTINPYRYRSYYYDEETGLYYVSSRYYDPEIGRFISADDAVYGLLTTTESVRNLFAYCVNNPINMVDRDGHAAANIIGGIIGGVIGALLGYIVADAIGLKGWKRWVLIGAVTVAGAVLGAILGPYIAKASKHIIRIINSGIRKASNAAIKASKSVSKWKIKNKHLSNAKGNFQKFNSTNKNKIRKWVSDALRSPDATFYPDGDDYYILTNMGKKIGTKGETIIKVCFKKNGFIKTAFPVKG